MKMVTVCSNCKRSCCWHGYSMCDKSYFAGTIDIPLEEALKLGEEHESYILPYVFDTQDQLTEQSKVSEKCLEKSSNT